MKTKTRLTLVFTFITASILLVFAFFICISAQRSREKEFYQSLRKEAITKANLFFNAKVATKTLQSIYKNNRKILNEVEVAIYNPSFDLLYHDAVDIDVVKETPQMITKIYQQKQITFYENNWQVIGLTYIYEDQTYIITAAAYDLYGYNKLNDLFWTITFGFIFSVITTFFAGRFFSKKAFEPILKMNKKAKIISATNLDLRLDSASNGAELSELATTFNEMLDRLENSFDAQKGFVSNVAHELRTPLAAIIAELDLSVTKDRTIIEYKSAINNALGDAHKLARLTTSLLDFAKASYDPSEISFKQVRVDEVLLDARQQVTQANATYKIDIHFENDFEEDQQIEVNGNEYLLKVAFANLFENGCKFSDNHQSTVSVSFDKNNINLNFSDKGFGISPTDLEHIFTPFYRGENNVYIEGNGIGLPLTQKIIKLHHGSISVLSTPKHGTVFKVLLPNKF